MPLQLSRVLHAGYQLELEGVRIVFDPIFEVPFSVNCHPFPAVRFDEAQVRALRWDAVFISHFHDDHCSLESLALLDRDTPIHVFCVFEELRELIRALGFTAVHALELDTPVVVGPLQVTPRRALDADVDSIFHIEAAGRSILHVVDSWIDPDTLATLAAHAPWDLVLWPFQTMRELEVLSPSRATPAPQGPRALPEEWYAQLTALAPRWVVPSSCQLQLEPWSWYNQAFFPISYRQFGAEVAALLPEARVLRLDPGSSVVFDGGELRPAPPLPWIERLDDEEVDYTYDPQLVPPTTAELAPRFPPLTAAEAERALDYCRDGLLARHRALDPPTDPYFDRPRVWQLSLYDHTGAATHLRYRLHGPDLERAPPDAGPLGWCTEVPLAKLHAALERGESLTSMYVRINDVRFDPETEAQLEGVDLLEDPLVRCLFTGVFGAYQRAQLRRLTAARASPPSLTRSGG